MDQMFSACLFGGRINEKSLECQELASHRYGKFSVAIAQANEPIEDQSQVVNANWGTFVGVYDGHGGTGASVYLKDHLLKNIEGLASEAGDMSAEILDQSIKGAEEGFLKLASKSLEREPSLCSAGSCCVVSYITSKMLFVANVGNCRAVLGINSGDKTIRAERLTKDHSAAMEEIRRELQALHPDDPNIVVFRNNSWLVKGIIEVSRSIGNLYLRKPWLNKNRNLIYGESKEKTFLSAEPYVHGREIRADYEFIIFASDGLWEHFSDNEATEIVHSYPRKGIARRLVQGALDKAAKRRGCINYAGLKKKVDRTAMRDVHDDITVIVVFLDRKGLAVQRQEL